MEEKLEIGMPLEKAEEYLTKRKIPYKVCLNSKPKIKTDTRLVTAIKKEADTIVLVVGDFLIGV